MRTSVRRKLEMGLRVRQFLLAHPIEGQPAATARARLDTLLARFEALQWAERTGRIADRRAVVHLRELHHVLHFRLLRHLVGAAAKASRDRGALLGEFWLPGINTPRLTFLVAARAMLTTADSVKDQLLAQGMSPSLLPELTRAMAAFGGTLEAGQTGRRGHLEARRGLEEAAGELTEEVAFLDSMVRFYFGQNPAVMACWKSARTVDGPRRIHPVETPVEEAHSARPATPGQAA